MFNDNNNTSWRSNSIKNNTFKSFSLCTEMTIKLQDI